MHVSQWELLEAFKRQQDIFTKTAYRNNSSGSGGRCYVITKRRLHSPKVPRGPRRRGDREGVGTGALSKSNSYIRELMPKYAFSYDTMIDGGCMIMAC